LGLWWRLLFWLFGPPLNLNVDDLQVADPSKTCTVPGCGGTMKLVYAPEIGVLGGLGLSQPIFVCDKDRTHTYVLSRDEDNAVRREHGARLDEAIAERRRRTLKARADKANVSVDDLLVPARPSKPCTLPGCGGTMEYKSGASKIDAFGEQWEWEWLSTFVCDKNETHAEVLSPDQDKAVWHEHRRRRKEANAELERRIKQARAERAKSRREPS
jgi:hypothetical protein